MLNVMTRSGAVASAPAGSPRRAEGMQPLTTAVANRSALSAARNDVE
jgi:hypothetical protein